MQILRQKTKKSISFLEINEILSFETNRVIYISDLQIDSYFIRNLFPENKNIYEFYIQSKTIFF